MSKESFQFVKAWFSESMWDVSEDADNSSSERVVLCFSGPNSLNKGIEKRYMSMSWKGKEKIQSPSVTHAYSHLPYVDLFPCEDT